MGIHILVDTGATHIININVARLIDLQEQCNNSTILMGSGNNAPYRAASFNVPLRNDMKIFYINAFLLDISNDIDIVLGKPWLADLECLNWDFNNMELQYFRNGHLVNFTTTRPRWTSTMVHTLPAPPPIAWAPLAAPPSPAGDITNHTCRCRRPNALDYINSTNVVFTNLRRAILQ